MDTKENKNGSGYPSGSSTLGLVEIEEVPRKRTGKKILKLLLVIAIYLGFIPFIVFSVPKITEMFIPTYLSDVVPTIEPNEKRIQSLKTDIVNLEKKIDKFTPGNVFLVINTTENHFTLYKNRRPILGGICSTGKYVNLEGENNKKWIFKTPRGEFKVLGKLTKPIWRKPDWAFVEDGLPIPSADDPSRYEKGTLGDYALVIGNGYMIHGTIYQRFLGLPVTHGCIRMGDDDLKVVYNTLPVGAKVFIY
jgi:lipoprotein-anchoring transpeptidase ErfK/SrfK